MKSVKPLEPEMIPAAIGGTIHDMARTALKRKTAVPQPRSIDAIAARLRATRQALGLSQTELCQRTKLARNTYNQWENAKGRPGLDQAIQMCDGLGVSLDWIYLGNPGALPYAIASKVLD